jgi:hypothetical protein
MYQSGLTTTKLLRAQKKIVTGRQSGPTTNLELMGSRALSRAEIDLGRLGVTISRRDCPKARIQLFAAIESISMH